MYLVRDDLINKRNQSKSNWFGLILKNFKRSIKLLCLYTYAVPWPTSLKNVSFDSIYYVDNQKRYIVIFKCYSVPMCWLNSWIWDIDFNKPIRQIPQCIKNIPQCIILQQKWAHVCTLLLQIRALWGIGPVYCGTWDRCIVRFFIRSVGNWLVPAVSICVYWIQVRSWKWYDYARHHSTGVFCVVSAMCVYLYEHRECLIKYHPFV